MSSTRTRKIKEKIKKNEMQRVKIHKLQRRIILAGTFGICSLIILLLFGYLQPPNQNIKSSFTVNNSKDIIELMNHFLTKIPTIDGEIASQLKITKEGAWISTSENTFFTLIQANYKTKEISYRIYESNFEVTGEWSIQFLKEDTNTVLKINEKSLTNNLGQRALLYWIGEDKYCQNLFKAFKNSL